MIFLEPGLVARFPISDDKPCTSGARITHWHFEVRIIEIIFNIDDLLPTGNPWTGRCLNLSTGQTPLLMVNIIITMMIVIMIMVNPSGQPDRLFPSFFL